jgi:hypothetical protein
VTDAHPFCTTAYHEVTKVSEITVPWHEASCSSCSSLRDEHERVATPLSEQRNALIGVAALLLAMVVPASAHIGSPDVFLEGNAGDYRVLVVVRMPRVIPASPRLR